MVDVERAEAAAYDTGVLIHGRHMQTEDVNRMLWGTPDFERHLGLVPTAVLTMLNAGPERISTLTIGSGASMRSPLSFEASVIFDTLCSRFDELEDFRSIREHPNWTNIDTRFWLCMAVQDTVIDVRAQDTEQEIANAAKLFEERGLTRVIHVTNRDHGPRCLDCQNRAREQEVIPTSQQWSIVTDDESFVTGLYVPPVVAEPPHRADDPTLQWDPRLWTPTLVRRLLELPPKERHAASLLVERVIGMAEHDELSELIMLQDN
jgi:hypothetical protein